MEQIKELQRHGKPINVAVESCKVGDVVVLHHDIHNVSCFKTGDILEIMKINSYTVGLKRDNNMEQNLMYKSRVYIISKGK